MKPEQKTNETNETRLIMLELGKACPNSRVFRNNTGTGWQSNKVIKNPKGFPPGSIVLIEPRPLHAGLCKGSSDLIGPTTIVITQDMVGKNVAVFTALEVKLIGGKGANEDQQIFLDFVNRIGGISAEVRTGEQAVDAIKNHKF